jgi:hypothetical protein
VEHSNAYTLSTIVPAHSKIEATLIIFESIVEVPFTTDLITVYADGSQVKQERQSGTFEGIQAGKVIAEYGTPTPI